MAGPSKWTSGIGCLLFLGIGVFQFISGGIGLIHIGGWIALITATLVSSFLKTELPFMIGTFICCVSVWRWPWPLALIATLPGSLFLIPGVVASAIDLLSGWRKNKESADPAPQQPTSIKLQNAIVESDYTSEEPITSVAENPSIPVNSPTPPPLPENSVATEKEESKIPPSGIGGLLSFFAFIALLQPFWLFAFYNELHDFHSLMPSLSPEVIRPLKSLLIASGVCAATVAVFAHITGQAILVGYRGAKKLANYYFATCMILYFIPYFYIIDLPVPMKAMLRQGMDAGVFGGCFWVIVWWLYFNLSKRVSKTYDPGLPVKPKSSILWAVYKSICLVIACFGTIAVTSSLIEIHKNAEIYAPTKMEISNDEVTQDINRVYGPLPLPSSKESEHQFRRPHDSAQLGEPERDFASQFDFSTWDRTIIPSPAPAIPFSEVKEKPKDEGKETMPSSSVATSQSTKPMVKPGHALLGIGEKEIWIPEPKGFESENDLSQNGDSDAIGATLRLGFSKFHEKSRGFSAFTLLTLDDLDGVDLTEADFESLIKAAEEAGLKTCYHQGDGVYATLMRDNTEHGSSVVHATVYCLIKGKVLILGYTADAKELPYTAESVVKKTALQWRDAIIAANK